jgi:hypothetical protein
MSCTKTTAISVALYLVFERIINIFLLFIKRKNIVCYSILGIVDYIVKLLTINVKFSLRVKSFTSNLKKIYNAKMKFCLHIAVLYLDFVWPLAFE